MEPDYQVAKQELDSMSTSLCNTSSLRHILLLVKGLSQPFTNQEALLPLE